MLNLQVAMIKEILSFVLPLIMLSPLTALIPTVEVTTPQEGQALQGSVNISGTVSADGFVSGDVSYAYDTDKNATWFFISTISQPVANGVLAVWDTSTISDGDYQLKVSAKYKNGETKEVIIHQMLVRNYTMIKSTEAVKTQEDSQAIEVKPTATESPKIVVTPFPTNSGSLEISQIQGDLQWGGILGILFLLFTGIAALIRWLKYTR
jgi:hypothetical protein